MIEVCLAGPASEADQRSSSRMVPGKGCSACLSSVSGPDIVDGSPGEQYTVAGTSHYKEFVGSAENH